jgi:hypothetical protein
MFRVKRTGIKSCWNGPASYLHIQAEAALTQASQEYDDEIQKLKEEHEEGFND